MVPFCCSYTFPWTGRTTLITVYRHCGSSGYNTGILPSVLVNSNYFGLLMFSLLLIVAWFPFKVFGTISSVVLFTDPHLLSFLSLSFYFPFSISFVAVSNLI